MATSNFSGKNSSSSDSPWEALEAGHLAWPDFSAVDQERIVRNYAPKIRYIALRLKNKLPKSVELGELISAGMLGLMEALGKFKPQLAIRFETYAENRIRGAMLDELRRLDWFSRSLRQKVRQLDEASWRIEHEKGRPPTEEELQEYTGLDEKDVRTGLEALNNQLCLPLDEIQDFLSVEGKNAGDNEPYRAAAFNQMVECMASLVSRLTPREKLVLSLYYTDELSMKETAEVMDITEGRVSQLHSQALARLRREFQQQFKDSGST